MTVRFSTDNPGLTGLSARLSGPVLLLMWALTLAQAGVSADLSSLATLLAWGFVILELPRLKAKQRRQILLLSAIGICTALLGWSQGAKISVIGLLGEHLKLAMLLTAVSFIAIAARVSCSNTHQGVPSFIGTLLGLHIFSSVANFASLILVGEQVKHRGRIDRISQVILSRGFGLAVLWSPFLSILPLVLEQVPQARLQTLYPFTISLAVLGLLVIFLETQFRTPTQLQRYTGYPLRFATLKLPLSLIAMILLGSQLWPSLATVYLVSLLAVVVPILLIALQSGSRAATTRVAEHIRSKLPESRPEISLFLSAGLLAAGVKACISAGLITLPFSETNALIATMVMFLIVLLAHLGIHQLALVAIFAGLLADVTTTPTLMAIAYILATALSMSGSTFSGISFIMKARFNCEDQEILSNNLPYTLMMLTLGTLILFLAEWLGVH